MSIFKVVHVHSDKKFVNNGKRFLNKSLYNIALIINGEFDQYEKEQTRYYDEVVYFDFDLEKISSFIDKYEACVIYELDYFKASLVNSIRDEIIIFWRFFGSELYSLQLKKMYTKKTQQALYQNLFIEKCKRVLRPMFQNQRVVIKAINRCNFFLGAYHKEYSNLKEDFPFLPPFLKLNINKDIITLRGKTSTRKKNVLLGNSKSPYNNHLDLGAVVERHPELTFGILFNYGQESRYTKNVRSFFGLYKNVLFYNDFMDTLEFNLFYKNVSTLILNSYRQLALGNIFIAIEYGVKIYLSKKNVLYYCLLESGIKVFDLEDFEFDCQFGSISLSDEEMIANIEALNLNIQNFSSNDFSKSIVETLKGV